MKKVTYQIASLVLVAGLAGCLPDPVKPKSDPDAIKEIAFIFDPGCSLWANSSNTLRDYILDAPAGTRFRFINGRNLTTAGKPITVPALEFPSHSAMEDQIGASLDDVFGAIESNRANASPEGGGTSDIPNAITHLMEERVDRPMSVLVLEPMSYNSPSAPGFAMKNCIPNDIAIATNRAASPFGTADLQGRLSNVVVHIVYPSEQDWPNHFFKQAVEEFYAKWVAAQKGIMASASPDLTGTLDKLNVPNQLAIVARAELDLHETRIFMLPITNQTPPAWMPTTVAAAEAIAASPTPVEIPEMAGRLGLGVVWTQPVDADLYAWVKGIGPVFYGCKSNAFAQYGTDFQNGTSGTEAEWITFTNVSSVEELEGFVNYFAGTNTAVHGKVILCWNGRVSVSDWAIAQTNGNHGIDVTQRANSPWWTRLDLGRMRASSR